MEAQAAYQTEETVYHPVKGPEGTNIEIEDYCLWYSDNQALFENTLDIEKGLVTALYSCLVCRRPDSQPGDVYSPGHRSGPVNDRDNHEADPNHDA